MARTFAEETVETSNTTGLGAYALEGAKGDYLPFEATYGSGDKPAYVVRNKYNTKWEMNRGGAGFTPGSPAALARNVWKSTNSNAPVPWTVDDLPLTVYVPASAEVHEGAITGWLATSRHPLLRTGARWWDDTLGLAVSWFETLVTGPATDARIGYYDAVKDAYFPDSRRPSVAVGAAGKTVAASDIGVCFSYNTTAAARTVTLPLGSTVKDGFTTSHVGLDIANGLIFAPAAGDGIDGGADGVSLAVPGRVPVSMRWDAARDTWASSYVPAQAPNWAGRRQTVAAGRVGTAGLPNILPASSVSLNLTTDLGGVALVVAAANGWVAANGRPNDLVGTATADITWNGLTASRAASAPNFLYLIVNADGTLTPGKTLLAPIYQEGGTPGTATGQFTFNIAEMKGYLGNGTTAPQTNAVFVGEAATDGSTVLSTVTYAYNGRYDSGYTGTLPSANTATARNHNIGVIPQVCDFRVKCTSTDAGYAVGEEISGSMMWTDDGAVNTPFTMSTSKLAASVITSTNIDTLNKTTGVRAALTRASWDWRMVARRGWG